MKRLIYFCYFLCFFIPSFAQNNFQTYVDARFGYSFLSSEKNTFFRNHNDVSEGEFLQNLEINVQNNNKYSWFSRLSFKARTGDRFDTGRMLSFSLEKTKKWKFSIKQYQNYDWFYNKEFELGNFNRNFAKNRLNLKFDYIGIHNLKLFAGYRTFETNGYGNLPYSQWLDFFTLQLNKDISKKTFYFGMEIIRDFFIFGVRQSYTTIHRKDKIKNFKYYNYGFSGQPISLLVNNSGEIFSDLSTTSIFSKLNFNKLTFSLDFSHQNGDTNTNIFDIKSYFFEDKISRNDFQTFYNGYSNTPYNILSVSTTYKFSDSLVARYSFVNRSFTTETNLEKSIDWLLFGTYDSPIATISDKQQEDFYYKHTSNLHKIAIEITPFPHFNVELKFENLDEKYRVGKKQNEYSETKASNNKIALGLSYSSLKYKIKGEIFTKNINDPLFRTAGKSCNGISVSGNLFISERLFLNGIISKVKKKNPDSSIQLNDKSLLYDINLSYNPKNYLMFSLGVTHTKIDFSTLLYFVKQEIVVTEYGIYNIDQNSFYLRGKIHTKNLRVNATIYYLNDNGISLPLNYLKSYLSIQWRLKNNLFALLGARYFDYTEEPESIHNYNLNQFSVGIRYLFR